MLYSDKNKIDHQSMNRNNILKTLIGKNYKINHTKYTHKPVESPHEKHLKKCNQRSQSVTQYLPQTAKIIVRKIV